MFVSASWLIKAAIRPNAVCLKRATSNIWPDCSRLSLSFMASSVLPQRLNSLNTVRYLSESTVKTPHDELDANSVIVTKRCAHRINTLNSELERERRRYLRITVDSGGCSGFQYTYQVVARKYLYSVLYLTLLLFYFRWL